jgi:hypothetical protein
VRTRTRLTTPPGQEPAAPHADDEVPERYVPGLALPHEPGHPGRFRRVWTVLLTIVLLATVAYVAFLVATSGQTFDPALNRDSGPEDQIIEQPTP